MADFIVTYLENSEYHAITGNTTATYDYVIPNGAVVTLTDLGANSPTNPTALPHADIIWDPAGANQLIYSTYSAGFRFSNAQFTGDGVKVIRIQLVNTLLVTANFGAYYRGTIGQ